MLKAANQYAEDQFSALVSHVLQDTHVTGGRAYSLSKPNTNVPKESDENKSSKDSNEDEVAMEGFGQGKGDNSAALNGLFHKDGVIERKYDLQESIVQEMHRMKNNKQTQQGEENKVNFMQVLHEMEHNRHFREYFLFHEASLANGLSKLDGNLGHRDYFSK